MFIFANAFNDVILFLLFIVFITQVIIPAWRNKKLFPLFRGGYKAVEEYNNEEAPVASQMPVTEKPQPTKVAKPKTKQTQNKSVR